MQRSRAPEPSRLPLWLVAGLCVALAVAFGLQWNRTRSLEAELERNVAEEAERERSPGARVSGARPPDPGSTAPPAERPPLFAGSREGADPVAGVAVPGAAGGDGGAPGGFPFGSPAMEQVMAQAMEGALQMQLAELEAAVEILPHEREEIEALLREQLRVGMDVGAGMMQGGAVDPTEAGERMREAQEDLEYVLGADRYQRYLDAQQRNLEKQMESMFQSQLAGFAVQLELEPGQRSAIEPLARRYGLGSGFHAMPTDPAEAGELAEELGLDAASMADGTLAPRDMMARMVALAAKRRAAFEEEVRPLLSDAQLELLEGWIRQQEQQLDMMSAFGAEAATPPPAR